MTKQTEPDYLWDGLRMKVMYSCEESNADSQAKQWVRVHPFHNRHVNIISGRSPSPPSLQGHFHFWHGSCCCYQNLCVTQEKTLLYNQMMKPKAKHKSRLVILMHWMSWYFIIYVSQCSTVRVFVIMYLADTISEDRLSTYTIWRLW